MRRREFITLMAARPPRGRVVKFANIQAGVIGLIGRGPWRSAAGPRSLGFWQRGAQNRGKERHLVDPRRQLGDELFQAVVQ